MKTTKMTKKDVRRIAGCRPVLSADYTVACYLEEKGFEPIGYNSGVYGWNYDVYEIGGALICAGYRPVGFDGLIKKTVTISDRENKTTDQVIRELLESVQAKK